MRSIYYFKNSIGEVFIAVSNKVNDLAKVYDSVVGGTSRYKLKSRMVFKTYPPTLGSSIKLCVYDDTVILTSETGRKFKYELLYHYVVVW